MEKDNGSFYEKITSIQRRRNLWTANSFAISTLIAVRTIQYLTYVNSPLNNSFSPLIAIGAISIVGGTTLSLYKSRQISDMSNKLFSIREKRIAVQKELPMPELKGKELIKWSADWVEHIKKEETIGSF